MNELVKVEPIALPDLARGKMPSLPAWLDTQKGALATNLQGDRQTGFQDVLTLPEGLLPTPAQRESIKNHLRSLHSFMRQTPENSDEAGKETLATVTKLLMVLAGHKSSDLEAEAKADAYMGALEDIPSWSVVAASRAWYRGQCGKDESGNPFDYRWPPDPANLRMLAVRQYAPITTRIWELERVLAARPYVDCSAELLEGKQAYRGLLKVLGERDFEKAKGLTIETAAEIGKDLPPLRSEGTEDGRE